jgi:hypothetical protein
MTACPRNACPHYIGQLCTCQPPSPEPQTAATWTEVDMRSRERHRRSYTDEETAR